MHSRGDCSFPWRKLGTTEKDAGTGALGSNTDYEECETAEDEEEDAADEEGEHLDLSTLLESAVTAVGTEAKNPSACERSGCARCF